MLGQRVVMKANPKYWREKQPLIGEVVLTVFGDNDSANAALERAVVCASG